MLSLIQPEEQRLAEKSVNIPGKAGLPCLGLYLCRSDLISPGIGVYLLLVLPFSVECDTGSCIVGELAVNGHGEFDEGVVGYHGTIGEFETVKTSLLNIYAAGDISLAAFPDEHVIP